MLARPYWQNNRLYSDFTSFPSSVLSLFQDPIQDLILHLECLFGLWSDSFSVISCFSWPYYSGRGQVRYTAECHLWVSLSHDQAEVTVVALLITFYQGGHGINMIVKLDHISRSGACQASFPLSSYFFLFSLFWKQITQSSSYSGEREN